jgi:hypothetical protein
MMTPGNAPQVSVQEATEAIVEKQEMRQKHTPGPWRVDPDYPTDVQSVDGPLEICTTNRFVLLGGVKPKSLAETVANALLIAAAPELLKALKSAKEFIENLQLPHEEWSITLDSLVAAIAKAEVPHVEPD